MSYLACTHCGIFGAFSESQVLIGSRSTDVRIRLLNRGRLTQIAVIAATAFVLMLNVLFILQTLGVPIPGLSNNS